MKFDNDLISASLMAIPIAALAGNREEQKLPETLKAGHCHRRFRKFLCFQGNPLYIERR